MPFPVSTGDTWTAALANELYDDIQSMLSAAGAAVDTSESTASTTYTDLATVGPSQTLTTGTLALVLFEAAISNNTAGAWGIVGFEVSGASTISANDTRSIYFESSSANDVARFAGFHPVTLTPGSNTVKLVYKTSGSGTATFLRRRLFVLPLGA